nr:copia protein [Tanacetum cinerariifolium]
MTRKLFPYRPKKATDLLEIIHTDVLSPLRHVSRQGASYFITFTDDYSRYGYVYLLKHKHEIQKVWTLVDLPNGKKAIGTKWVYRNKKDERGIVVRNKARLVARGHAQEEDIDYDEVFAHVAKVEAINLFLAFASYMNFLVYQIDVKSAFLYGTIEEEVYVSQPPGFVDPEFLEKIYKVEKA